MPLYSTCGLPGGILSHSDATPLVRAEQRSAPTPWLTTSVLDILLPHSLWLGYAGKVLR